MSSTTEFNVGALAQRIAATRAMLDDTPHGHPMHTLFAARLAGLSEAWMHMTRTPEELAEVVEHRLDMGWVRERMQGVELEIFDVAAAAVSDGPQIAKLVQP